MAKPIRKAKAEPSFSHYLEGLKENVIVGHLIPAGTGGREYEDIVVGSMEEYDSLMASKKENPQIVED